MDRKTIITVIIIVSIAILVVLAGPKILELIRSQSEPGRVKNLLPQVRQPLEDLRQALAAQGIQTFVGSTSRTVADQAAILLKGTSTTTRSWHLLKRAVDLYPRRPDGRPDWDEPVNLENYRIMHRLAPVFGFEGIAFNSDGSKKILTNKQGKKFWDGGHLQFREGMTFRQASA